MTTTTTTVPVPPTRYAPAHRQIESAVIVAITNGSGTRVPVPHMVDTTILALPSGGWAIKYHYTFVAAFGPYSCPYVDLSSGGYYTATTARRMNQALAASGRRDWRVTRRAGKFVLVTPTFRVEFAEDFVIDASGKVTHVR